MRAAGSLGSESLDPAVDGDVIHFDASFSEEFFNVSVGESVSEVPADGEHDHFGWEPIASERRTVLWRWLVAVMVHRNSFASDRADPSTQQCRLKVAMDPGRLNQDPICTFSDCS